MCLQDNSSRDICGLITMSRPSNPFIANKMEEKDFLDFGSLADEFINTKKLNIKKLSFISVNRYNPSVLYLKAAHNKLNELNEHHIFNKGKRVSGLPPPIALPKIIRKKPKRDAKEDDIRMMIQFLEKEEHKMFYSNLLGIPEDVNVESDDTEN